MSTRGSDPGDHPGNRWAEIDALFARALDLPETERDAFLQSAPVDEGIRAEARRLLDLDEEADGFLEGPLDTRSLGDLEDAVSASGGTPPSELDRSGERLGAYRLVRRLARGGMASVYLAERADGAWEQTVAVKVLRPGLDTEDVLARFRAERQILSSLTHPNIGRLLDGGATPDSHPYLVMEFVDGVPATTYADRQRLSIEERLRLFQQIGHAVAAAHRSLVIHRDIKPSNILVTEDGRAKLLDFGIAKILDPTEMPGVAHRTRTGVRLMTPEYASPEQLEGAPVTTASDVFQLGVLLFRLLTGVTPFETKRSQRSDAPRPATLLRGLEEEQRDEIAAARSTSPGQLTRSLRGEVEAIMLKAMDEDPDRRYSSAEAMVDDVERYLSGHPVEARPASALHRTRKFLGRHRWVGPTAALLLLSGLGYMVTLARHATELERERNRAQAEARTAQSVTDFVVGLFGATDPYEGGRANTPARDILDQGARLVLDGEWESPEVRARLLTAVATAYSELDLHREAVDFLQVGLQASDLPAEDRVTLRSLLGYSLVRTGGYEEARELLEETTAARVASGDTLSHRYLRDLIMISTALFLEGEGEAALEATEAWLDQVESRGEVMDDLTFSALDRVFHLAMGDLSYQRAQQVAIEKLAHARDLYPDTTPIVAHAYEDIASTMVRQGRYREALEPALVAAELTTAIFGVDHPTTTYTTETLASIYLELGEPEEALEIQSGVLDTRLQALGEDHIIIPMTRHTLARALRATGRTEEADAHLDWAIERTAAAYGMESRLTTVMLEERARVRMDQGRLDEAEELLTEIGDRYAASYDPTDMRRIVWSLTMADLRVRQGRQDEARAVLREGVNALLDADMGEHALHRRISAALDELEGA